MDGMSSMIDLFEKVKQAAGALPTNLDEGVPGRLQVREGAPGRAPEGLGAPWGEGPLQSATPQYSTAVEHEVHEGRDKLLGRIFEGVPGMAAADSGLLKGMFQHFGGPSTTSHSPLLQKAASHAPPPTLAETLRRLR